MYGICIWAPCIELNCETEKGIYDRWIAKQIERPLAKLTGSISGGMQGEIRYGIQTRANKRMWTADANFSTIQVATHGEHCVESKSDYKHTADRPLLVDRSVRQPRCLIFSKSRQSSSIPADQEEILGASRSCQFVFVPKQQQYSWATKSSRNPNPRCTKY